MSQHLKHIALIILLMFCQSLLVGQNIVYLEYFIDQDPGFGLASEIPIDEDTLIELNFAIPLTGLTNGNHTFYVRAKDSLDNWSFIQKQSFVYEHTSSSDVNEIEYYFDTDPGIGLGFTFPQTPGPSITATDDLDLSTLIPGVHVLYTRAKNENERWSFPQKQSFLFDDQRVEHVEFKFDSLPGYSDWVSSNPFTPDFIVEPDISFTGVCDLDTGVYHINARARRQLSWWSDVFTDSIEIKNFYDYNGVILDQFDDPIASATMYFAGADTLESDGLGEFFTLLPKCWGDTISAFKDSAFSASNSYYFENPLVDFRANHVLHDLDTILYGYKCLNNAGSTGSEIVYICENVTVDFDAAGTLVDTGSVSAFILHDGEYTVGNILDSNFTGELTNDGTYPRNQKLYISSVVGRPVDGFPDLFHPCTDVELPGRELVFLDIQDSTFLQLDSSGMASVEAADLLLSDCLTCEIVNINMTQSSFDCDDYGLNMESLLVDNGGESNASCPIIVQVNDTLQPVVTCRSDTLVHTDPAMCDFTPLNGLFQPDSIWDNCPTSQVNDFNLTSSLDGSAFPLGIHMVEWLITDPEGNQDSCTFTVTVEDHEPPGITCPTDATVSTDLQQCTHTIGGTTFNPVSVTDNCPDFTYSNSLDASNNLMNYTLPLGINSITWTVDDQHGQTASCVFAVTVEDTEAPEIQCAGNAIRNTDPGVCTYTIQGDELDLENVADNCADFTFSNDFSASQSLAGSILELGENVITWTVDDQHGNTASCILTITVEDNELPEIVCPGNTTRHTAADQCTYSVLASEFNPVSASDNCTDFLFFNNINNTDTLNQYELPQGPNEIIWTVDDQHGQVAQCSLIVTVVDTQQPSIQCPPDVTLSITSAHCDTNYSYNVLTTDNCPDELAELTAGLGSGQPFPIGVTTEEWQVSDIDANSAICSFNITVEQLPRNISDTICYGDSIYLEGAWQYNPGLYIDTFMNNLGCDSVVLTDLDTTTYCIWPSEIVYVDSSSSGANTGVDWPNAYTDLQLAFDIGRRYLNITQVWVAEGTYYPTSGLSRTISFDVPDELFILGGFVGVESDSMDRNFMVNKTRLSGNIGNPLDSLDNSRHVLKTGNSSQGSVVDGFIIQDGVANFGSLYGRSGGGLINRGQLTLSNCIFSNCASLNPGKDIVNLNSNAELYLHSTILTSGTNASILNTSGAQIHITGNTVLGN